MGVETTLRAPRHAATPAMTDDSQLSFTLPTVSRKKVTAAFDGGRLSSDAGVMLLALAERRRKVADTLAAHIADRRSPSHITHTVADVLRARMLAIGCGYPDGNDFDRLRCDPAFKLACGRLPDTGRDLCSQPTISRWENAPTLREIIRSLTRSSTSGAGAIRSRPSPWCWTSTTRSTSCTAISSWRNGTPIMMSAAFCRFISTIRQRAG